MNWSGISNNSILGKLLRLILKLVPSHAIIPILQGRLRGYRWIVGSSTNGCWLGTYEYEKQKCFEENVKTGDVVFDLGSNVGFYTLLASRVTGPNGKVFAFEPLPLNLEYLKKHIQINNIRNVAIIEAAVSNISGTLNFKQGQSSSMGRLATDGDLEVKTVILDELLANGEISLPNFTKNRYRRWRISCPYRSKKTFRKSPSNHFSCYAW